MFLKKPCNRSRRAVIKKHAHLLSKRGRFEAPRSKVENSLDLFPRQAVVEFNKLVECQSIFEVFEYHRDRHASSPEHPGTAHLSWHAFHGGTLRPIKRRQGTGTFCSAFGQFFEPGFEAEAQGRRFRLQRRLLIRQFNGEGHDQTRTAIAP